MEADRFDADALLAACLPETRAALARLQVLDEIDSTQSLAAREPVPPTGTTAYFAKRQSAGRGRRGRIWQSPGETHLAFTLLRRCSRPPQAMSGFSLAIGVAAAEALRASGYPQVRVKWPNDLVCALGKLGGILVELREPSARGCTLLVGIGLNLRLPAESAIDQPACDLTRLRAAPPARLPIAAALLDRLLPALAEFERAGWPAFAPRWTAFDALAGREVQVLDGGRGLDGRVLGVDADGALRLAAADGEHRVLAGEVSLRLHEAAHG